MARAASDVGGFWRSQGRVVLKVTIAEGSSTAAVVKTPVAQFARASVEADAEVVFDEPLSRVPSVDFKEKSSGCPVSFRLLSRKSTVAKSSERKLSC